MADTENRRIVLAARPVGEPKPTDFRLVREPVPEPGPGQALLRTRWLSLDPYMRGRMNAGKSYAAPVEIDGLMPGGTISEVVASNLPELAVGDHVLAFGGWQDYSLTSGKAAHKIARGPHETAHLGVLGMPGRTAYVGLLEIGKPKPGETVVVAAASGPVGSMVGQIARIKGCRAVGIAGGTEKCRFVKDELGFDVAIDHRAADFPDRLKAACPDGIDIYFENVGGAVWQAVLPLLNTHARVPLCGLVSSYNATEPPAGPDRSPAMMRTFLSSRITVRGFIVSDFAEHARLFEDEAGKWLADGLVKYREDVVEGLENAPAGLIGLLKGKNFGKAIVKVS
ncbi:MAG TPA: NADP-dependent oxidoreductase [Hyphomicrobiales bacterium]|nr:NADP-dependent oxidoreductase [Hyphomicrobiales bacterium]